MEKEKLEAALQRIRFQLENAEGWIASGDMELATIKARCLVEEVEALKALLQEEKNESLTSLAGPPARR